MTSRYLAISLPNLGRGQTAAGKDFEHRLKFGILDKQEASMHRTKMHISLIVVLSLTVMMLTAFADEKLTALKVGSETYSNVTVMRTRPVNG
jgi:hypothetical protein